MAAWLAALASWRLRPRKFHDFPRRKSCTVGNRLYLVFLMPWWPAHVRLDDTSIPCPVSQSAQYRIYVVPTLGELVSWPTRALSGNHISGFIISVNGDSCGSRRCSWLVNEVRSLRIMLWNRSCSFSRTELGTAFLITGAKISNRWEYPCSRAISIAHRSV